MPIRRPPAGRLLDAVFGAGYLAYIRAGIDTRLIYHWQGPAFYATSGFAAEYLRRPGGPAEYLARLLAQVYPSQAGGALTLTLLAAAAATLTELYFSRLARGAPALPVRFLPALALLFAANLYYDQTPLAVALLLGIGGLAGFQEFLARRRGAAAIAVAFVATSAAVYWLGGMALVLFAPSAAILIAGHASRPWLGVSLIGLAAALPAGVEHFRLFYSPASARGWFFDPDPRRAVVWWSLYLFYALGTALLVAPKRPGRPAKPRRRLAAAFAAIATLASLAAVARIASQSNARDRRLAALDYHTWHEEWPAVIEAARALPAGDFNSLTRSEINLALHETHRLGDEMFHFPQRDSLLPRLRAEVFLPYMIRITDLCLRLGRVNEAERFSHEASILGSGDARVLSQIAQVQLIQGRAAAARKTLQALAGETGSARWSRERLAELDTDPQLVSVRNVQLLRRRMLRNDDVFPVWQNPDKPEADLDRMLLDQLEQDPSNRMAFEYLMGNYLLARDLAAARALAPRIQNMTGPAYESPGGKRRTPRHYQEAMALYADTGGKPVEAGAFEIEPGTLERMTVFKRIMAGSPSREAAKAAAWETFRHTYFFYFVFGPGDYR